MMQGYKEEDGAVNRTGLTDVLTDRYGLSIRSLTFVPAGECSHAYVADTDRGQRFVKIYRRASGDWASLEARLAAVAELGSLPGVVAPVVTLDGRYLVSTSAGPMAVFPYVPAGWTDPASRSDDDIDRAAALLAAVHSYPDGGVRAGLRPFGDSLDVPFADVLRGLMMKIDAPATATAGSPIHALLRDHRREILAALDDLEALSRQVRQTGVDLTVTHGDPNHANLLQTDDGSLYLVDWDDIALGPIERDLVFFSGPRFQRLWRAYAAARDGASLHEDVITLYLWLWDLQEIADYGTRLARGGMSTAETSRSWDELMQYLPLRAEEISASAHAMIVVALMRE